MAGLVNSLASGADHQGDNHSGEARQIVPVRLRIGPKLMLALAGLLAATVMVSGVAMAGLGAVNAKAQVLYRHNLLTAQAIADLQAKLDAAAELALQLLLFENPAERSRLTAELEAQIVPAIDEQIVALRTSYATDAGVEPARLERLAGGWAEFKRLLRSGLDPRTEPQEQALTRKTVAILDPITTAAAELAASEVANARQSQEQAEATYRATRLRIVEIAAAAAVVWLVISLLLVRNLVPRVQGYSRFAARVANGHPGEQLTVRGADELAELGHALNELVQRREQQRAYEETQTEFADTMQLSETEPEAHDLLKHHLERSIPHSRVNVLNRNNSADRLEAATPVAAECPLATSLQGAKPRSCLAVRFGRGYQGGGDRAPLLACGVCGPLSDAVTCEPLLVGGEVIGSVLVNHPDPPGADAPLRIRESVTQAAPVLANLRNLAIAEVRAATDALTGLPNNRAVQDTIKRMVAQASRQVSPLSAALLDLDHFKHINDAYGHSRGDEVLAAVATVLRSSVRDSDFVGRYGGEEFLILLPDTDKQQAAIVADKVRAAVANLGLSDIDQSVTASLGVAALPDDAGDADTLIRAADRALYAAKGNGRNRVELFISPANRQPQPPTPSTEPTGSPRPGSSRAH
jgi:diguanylate cyclase (GGDEF)-like protein